MYQINYVSIIVTMKYDNYIFSYIFNYIYTYIYISLISHIFLALSCHHMMSLFLVYPTSCWLTKNTMSPVSGRVHERDPLKTCGTFPVDSPELPSPIFIVCYGSHYIILYHMNIYMNINYIYIYIRRYPHTRFVNLHSISP